MPRPERLDDLKDLRWIGAVTGSASDRALRRLARTLGTTFDTRHAFFDFDTALSLVAANQGVAMLPALALERGDVPEGVEGVGLTGLGSRRIVARHRATRHEPGPAVRAVVDAMVEVTRDFEPT
jgi:DNA-binding transcriptional LysR family regulator